MGAFTELQTALAANKTALLLTVLEAEGGLARSGDRLVAVEGQLAWSSLEPHAAEQLLTAALAEAAAVTSGPQAVQLQSGEKLLCFLQLFNPPPRLIILGGGHIGAALSRMAALLDYEIVVVDDRPSFASRDRHPDAHRLICNDFVKALAELRPTSSDYIVIVTRGHRHDRICLEQALGRPAAYIGMIGSRKRVREMLEDLARSGFDREKLAAVHTPIGLDIGAVTEGEIALSILAEITAVRRSGSGQEPIQEEVLAELAALERQGGRAVLATIVSTLGSTPRSVGTRMLVYPDGRISGTVGGGCGEAAVRQEALLVLEAAQPRLFNLNLTADAAAEEGMACGGRMKVFLEPLDFS